MKDRTLILIYILSGCWMFGIGLRWITNYFVNPNTVYPSPTPEMWDWWFDWLPQVPLGLCLIVIGFKLFYDNRKDKYKYS